ncbi:putative thiamine diphosphokinase [Peptacetobacter hiranonis DSM 13275]|uniref:Putative thiamine diphosphokinase n=2 Tax=Peptacetobacter TaxID=2743582 RepID=B6FZ49_PEPHT|nr:putative thiamine diphosphokinase [Peptacetobacter hiranonis DSM 13275]
MKFGGFDMIVKAPIRVDRKTKKLAKRIQPGEIAVINHVDIDEVAANSLVEAKVKLVINAAESISGRYPNKGPGILTENNILIIDRVGEELFNNVSEGETLLIEDGKIFRGDELIGEGDVLTREKVAVQIKLAYDNLGEELDRFIDNTIEYAKKEKGFILGEVEIPKVKTIYQGKQVLIVVRGQDYKEDLATMISYIEEVKPILVGVDGGADALMEFGYKPDVVVGDMDSVSDESLKAAGEIVVHAYTDGRAPGLKRVQDLGLDAVVFPAPGTSEDIAMLIAYEYNAELIVALGTHSNIIDFLEKGRKGMASTFLVRMKIGAKLIDAKGVNLLYRSKLKIKYIWALIATALFPVLILASLSPRMQQFIQLMQLKLRIMLNM